ncbi:YgeY family selenium metabolism-linked hydrolase [Chloroflexota bacterium]
MSTSSLNEESARIADDVIAFARKLIQTPSISCQEQDVARLILTEMNKLDYDEAFTDAMGNVVGIIKGSGRGEKVMFNSHMDHVDPGQPEAWQFDPYGGDIADGYLHGRGSCDMKGAVATQVYAAALIKNLGLPHSGDIIVTAVVQEEPSECLGTNYVCDVTLAQRGIKPDFVVLGEPSDLNFSLGHRGKIELEVKTHGRTSHSSAPWRGINAVYKMLPVIARIQTLDTTLPRHESLGKGSISLTIISCSPGRLSIVPDLCTVALDRRFTPGMITADCIAQIEAILKDVEQSEPDFEGSVRLKEIEETSYTGMKLMAKKEMLPWVISADHPKVVKALAAVREQGQQPGLGYWDFATDGSHTAGVLDIPTLGYGPGEEALVHTPQEQVAVDSLVKSVAGNAAIALAVCK